MGTFFEWRKPKSTDEVKIPHIVCSVQLWPVEAFHLWKSLGHKPSTSSRGVPTWWWSWSKRQRGQKPNFGRPRKLSDSDISYICSHLCRNLAFSAGFHLLHYCIQAFCEFVSLLLNTIATLSHGGHTHWKCLKLSGAGQFHNSCFQLIGCVLIVFFGDGSVEASQLSAELANATNAIQESISMTWKFEFQLSASRRRMIRMWMSVFYFFVFHSSVQSFLLRKSSETPLRF